MNKTGKVKKVEFINFTPNAEGFSDIPGRETYLNFSTRLSELAQTLSMLVVEK
jgi:hypothetical protein